jgi:hypothetical protein
MLIFRADIVLEGIAANISALLDAWWENPNIVECLQRLDRVRHLYWDNVPIYNPLSSSTFSSLWFPNWGTTMMREGQPIQQL